MKSTLALPQYLFDQLDALMAESDETGAVLLARPARLDDNTLRLIGVELIPVPEHAYLSRAPRAMSVSSDAYMTALSRAETQQCVAIWVHTHPSPGCLPLPSLLDEEVDRQLTETFTVRTGSSIYASLVLARTDNRLSFTGCLHGSEEGEIDRIFVAGPRFTLLVAQDQPTPALPEFHDRHVRTFGPDAARLLGQLRIAVVGVGGTGSAVAEQLVRLGVRQLTLIDPDTLSSSNVTRVYGSHPTDVGRRKVDVAADHLRLIAPDASIRVVPGSVSQKDIARTVVGADVVFGCTDDDAGRMRLSRFSYGYLTPLIDCGVLIDSTADYRIRDIIGRVTVLYPGTACLLCRGRVSPQRAAAQERPRDEQRRLEGEGYAPALNGVEPAVVAFTTLTASMAVNELLDRLIGYGPQPLPSETLLLIHDRRTSTNSLDANPNHYCGKAAPGGFGDDPHRYWGLSWPTS